MLWRGELIGAVLASFLGNCSAGRAAQQIWLAVLMQLPTLHARRKVLEHFLRMFELAERHGSMWRVVSPAAFVGHQHEWRPLVCVDPETGEVFEHVTKLKRYYCPKARAKGLAEAQHKSPRQLNRYRRFLRSTAIMASKRPPAHARDAVMPRARRPNGEWAYAQHWLTLAPTPEMLRRWRGTTPPRHAPPDLGHVHAAPRRDDLWDLQALIEEETSDRRRQTQRLS